MTDAEKAASKNGAALLYVEDETIIRESVAAELGEAGFEVTAASDGTKALAILNAAPEGFRGLITDVNLGKGPDGWEVARRARELNSTMPVVYVSGGSNADWASRGVPHSVMIEKPFATAQIIVGISSLLNRTDKTP